MRRLLALVAIPALSVSILGCERSEDAIENESREEAVEADRAAGRAATRAEQEADEASREADKELDEMRRELDEAADDTEDNVRRGADRTDKAVSDEIKDDDD